MIGVLLVDEHRRKMHPQMTCGTFYFTCKNMLYQIALTFTIQMLNNPPVVRDSVLCLLQTAVQDLEPTISLSKYVHQVVHLIQKECLHPMPPSHYMERGFIQNVIIFQSILEDPSYAM